MHIATKRKPLNSNQLERDQTFEFKHTEKSKHCDRLMDIVVARKSKRKASPSTVCSSTSIIFFSPSLVQRVAASRSGTCAMGEGVNRLRCDC